MRCPESQSQVHWLTFRSTRDAIRAEHQLRAQKIAFRVVAVPRGISSECGMAFEFLAARDVALQQKVAAALAPCAVTGTWHHAAADNDSGGTDGR